MTKRLRRALVGLCGSVGPPGLSETLPSVHEPPLPREALPSIPPALLAEPKKS